MPIVYFQVMNTKKQTAIFFSCILLGSVVFASWLMFHTFSYDAKTSSMLIAVKAWSDFGAHIPLIRSFSLGNNWPPEYPLFPGEPIRYHFLFYFLVGFLEKIGIRIDWALNVPSIMGFAGLLFGIGLTAHFVFKDRRITLLSILFFLLNGSLSFVRFFKTHPLSPAAFVDISANKTFPSFAPWGEGEITAFWNLNIYTNQRHLAVAFACALLFMGILLWIERKPLKKQLPFIIPEVLILALLPYFHQPILIILAIVMVCYFVLFPNLRAVLFVIGIGGMLYILPQLSPLLSGTKTVHWEPWFLMEPPRTLTHAFSYWFQNIGLHLFFIPIGWLLAPPRIKKIFFPLVVMFLIPNLLQFSVEMAANHKFFNFFLILGNMLSAFGIIWLFTIWKKRSAPLAYVLVVVSVALLTLSGIIDFFPIANDNKITLVDIPANEVATWIRDNTPADAVFLNSMYFFHPASIAGRKIVMGWPYFAWSAGYDTYSRAKDIKALYETQSITTFCNLVKKYRISFITYQEPSEMDDIQTNDAVLRTRAIPVYESPDNTYRIYTTIGICN